MKTKTYLTAVEQWVKTAALATHLSKERPLTSLGDNWILAQATTTRRLFLAGDMMVLCPNNGMYERFPAFCVSSRGYKICGLYLQFGRRETSRIVKPEGWSTSVHLKEGGQELKGHLGPLRIVEYPDRLTGKRPDDPDVRLFVESLRTGNSVAG